MSMHQHRCAQLDILEPAAEDSAADGLASCVLLDALVGADDEAGPTVGPVRLPVVRRARPWLARTRTIVQGGKDPAYKK